MWLIQENKKRMKKMCEDFSYSEYLRNLVSRQRPLEDDVLNKICEAELVESVYNNCAIEGNTLTLSETKFLLEYGITVAGKSFKEHLQQINLRDALGFVEEIVKVKEKFTERDLLDIHEIVLRGEYEGERRNMAGRYRLENVFISGGEHIPPDSLLVKEQMKELFTWYTKNKDVIHPISLASGFHQKLTEIHPFIDGNGRTARLCLNFMLIQAGYLPIIIKATPESRLEYINGLETAHMEGNLLPFTNFIKNASCEALKKRLFVHSVKYDTEQEFKLEREKDDHQYGLEL